MICDAQYPGRRFDFTPQWSKIQKTAAMKLERTEYDGYIVSYYSKTELRAFDVVKLVREKIKYEQQKWLISVDLEEVSSLIGLQSDSTKYHSFPCEWDSRTRLQNLL